MISKGPSIKSNFDFYGMIKTKFVSVSAAAQYTSSCARIKVEWIVLYLDKELSCKNVAAMASFAKCECSCQKMCSQTKQIFILKYVPLVHANHQSENVFSQWL